MIRTQAQGHFGEAEQSYCETANFTSVKLDTIHFRRDWSSETIGNGLPLHWMENIASWCRMLAMRKGVISYLTLKRVTVCLRSNLSWIWQ
jgi:hypothetical protein